MDSRFQVALCLLVGASLAQGRPGFLHSGILGYSVVPVSASSQYHSQDVLGQYSYGYSDGLTAKSEVKTLDGVTRGGYTYIDADGVLQSARYTADATHGFRVTATNLPVAPKVPAVAATTTAPEPATVAADLPVPVEDTPEVAAAKVAHKAAYEAAAAAAAAAPETPTVVHVPTGFSYSAIGVPYYTPLVTKLHIFG